MKVNYFVDESSETVEDRGKNETVFFEKMGGDCGKIFVFIME
jgi:hypothetical protein